MLAQLDTLSPIWTLNPVNRAHPINRGRLGWWLVLPHIYGGRQWFDLMGLYHGTLTNMGTSSNGWRASVRHGAFGAMHFNGTNNYINVGSLQVVSRAAFTVSAWFRTNDTGTNQKLYFEGNSADNAPLGGISLNNGVVRGELRDNGPTHTITMTSPGTYNDNAWHHAVFVQTGLTARALYVDGLQVATDSATISTMTLNTSRIGVLDRLAGTSSAYLGDMDDVAAWARALSAAEVFSLYNLSRRGYPGVLNRMPRVIGAAPASFIPRRALMGVGI